MKLGLSKRSYAERIGMRQANYIKKTPPVGKRKGGGFRRGHMLDPSKVKFTFGVPQMKPGKPKKGDQLGAVFFDALRAHPGEWAALPTGISQTVMRQIVWCATWLRFRFETCRDMFGGIWVRYVGTITPAEPSASVENDEPNNSDEEPSPPV